MTIVSKERYAAAIPEHLLESLLAYLETGRPTGGFLEAVIANDLLDAVGRADPTSLSALKAICQFVYVEVPMEARGSREAWRAWVAAGRARLEQAGA